MARERKLNPAEAAIGDRNEVRIAVATAVQREPVCQNKQAVLVAASQLARPGQSVVAGDGADTIESALSAYERGLRAADVQNDTEEASEDGN